jgi:hypothetical protein
MVSNTKTRIEDFGNDDDDDDVHDGEVDTTGNENHDWRPCFCFVWFDMIVVAALLSRSLLFIISLQRIFLSSIGKQPLPRNIRNRNQKFDKNITKRGHVPVGKAAERQDEFPVSQTLILFFLVVVVGSSLVQVFNLFGGSASKPPVE